MRDLVRVTLLQSLFVCVGFLASCHRKSHDDEESPPPATFQLEDSVVEDRELWLNRAEAVLRKTDFAAFKDEGAFDQFILDRHGRRKAALLMMNDDQFYNLIADFGMFWLGKQQSKFYQSFEYNNWDDGAGTVKRVKVYALSKEVKGSGAALAAARAVKGNKRFLEAFFAPKSPLIAGYDFIPVMLVDKGTNISKMAQTDLAKRKQIRQDIYAFVDQVLQDALKKFTSEGLPEACSFLEAKGKDMEFNSGYMQQIGTLFDQTPISFSKYDLMNKFYFCEGNPPTTMTENDLKSRFERILKEVQGIHERLNAIEEIPGVIDNEDQTLVTALKPVDRSIEGVPQTVDSWNINLFTTLANSSTNRNRKRANWVLQRFFCDDLTPLNVSVPADHAASGDHGSNPACYSCHYKLDPMAGFFRERGYFGFSFAKSEFIVFDDFAQSKRATYEAPWKATANSSRAWNIGYIRSTQFDDRNTYGSNLDDLFTMLKQAPEVKQCFVRRVVEYVVGQNQATDHEWTQKLLTDYETTEHENPQLAMKGLFADVIASQMFAQVHRSQNECYDYVGEQSPSQLPCQIRSIIHRNCASCHSASSALGGLNLETWNTYQGETGGFTIATQAESVSGKKALERIMERINSSDDQKRMPLMQTMADVDRQMLFHWLDEKTKQ